ncbi:DUF2726 domain-containing protein [Micromonospora sp. WMMC241]|uniref:DUF2726 domain-containing protein n=1 Tax=Micromonospora sp. WMMC241 TaxID=3015159 RepID=UPI0022B6FBF6|nr:DUF2726 domain-containing protein [Micromonospora sp. WMMC241]MCZ7437224.1 DUF2726 domain-containing protein [Micromonospora sp. WMMC241]
MTSTGSVAASWLRPIRSGAAPRLAHAGHVGYADRRLAELALGRPPGITGSQWSTAGRARLDLVACAADTGLPRFAVRFGAPAPDGSAARRADRLTDAVCAAVGLPLLRVESSTLGGGDQVRRFVAYVLDARAYAEGTDPDGGDTVGFRDIVGRLPDGRRGPVNDLGALARAEAVGAYVAGRLADPIVRGLHVRWTDGPAEGWGWVEVRPGRCLVERVRLTSRGFSCGVEPGRLAEDLAAMALGERLRDLDADATSLVDRDDLRGQVRRLAARRDSFDGGFAFDHLCAD